MSYLLIIGWTSLTMFLYIWINLSIDKISQYQRVSTIDRSPGSKKAVKESARLNLLIIGWTPLTMFLYIWINLSIDKTPRLQRYQLSIVVTWKITQLRESNWHPWRRRCGNWCICCFCNIWHIWHIWYMMLWCKCEHQKMIISACWNMRYFASFIVFIEHDWRINWCIYR